MLFSTTIALTQSPTFWSRAKRRMTRQKATLSLTRCERVFQNSARITHEPILIKTGSNEPFWIISTSTVLTKLAKSRATAPNWDFTIRFCSNLAIYIAILLMLHGKSFYQIDDFIFIVKITNFGKLGTARACLRLRE